MGKIETLEIGYHFNQPLHDVDFGSIKKLIFEDYLTGQDLTFVDFCDIKELTLGYHFNKPLNNVKWGKIEILTISSPVYEDFNFKDWRNIKKLNLNWIYRHKPNLKIPRSIKISFFNPKKEIFC